MRRLLPPLLATLALVSMPRPGAGGELTVTSALTIQEAGPRAGAAGTRFFNVEGKNNEKYASFGLLEFRVPREDAANATGLTLALTQSIARFSKNGKVKIYLSEDAKTATDTLRFKGENGLDDQLKPLSLLGEHPFDKGETGKPERITLTVDEKALAAFRKQADANGKVRLVLAPADGDVAATYFGAECDDVEQRPKLLLKTAP